MRLGELTWSQVEAIPKDKIILVPMGSFEQHGRHLPLLTDTIIVTALADRIQEARRDCTLLLPELWVGYSAHHVGFPGTLTVDSNLIIELFCQIVQPLMELGFRKVLVLNGHGGNVAPAKLAMRELQRRCAPDKLRLVLMSDWTGAKMLHACEVETSILLHLRPDLVKMDEARAEVKKFQSDFFSFDFDDPAPDLVYLNWAFHEITATGALGHPERANAEEGRRIFEAMVEETCRFVDEFSNWD